MKGLALFLHSNGAETKYALVAMEIGVKLKGRL